MLIIIEIQWYFIVANAFHKCSSSQLKFIKKPMEKGGLFTIFSTEYLNLSSRKKMKNKNQSHYCMRLKKMLLLTHLTQKWWAFRLSQSPRGSPTILRKVS